MYIKAVGKGYPEVFQDNKKLIAACRSGIGGIEISRQLLAYRQEAQNFVLPPSTGAHYPDAGSIRPGIDYADLPEQFRKIAAIFTREKQYPFDAAFFFDELVPHAVWLSSCRPGQDEKQV